MVATFINIADANPAADVGSISNSEVIKSRMSSILD
jgi:hypothetical protein